MENPEGGYLLNGRIEQLNTEFTFVIGIYMKFDGKDLVGKQLVKTKDHRFQLKLDAKPDKVEINKQIELMCKIKKK